MTATAPASATTSRPSRNGKKASDATTEPASVRPACPALIEAMRAESIRLIWPAPTPSVWPAAQKTIAFDFTNLATRQAKSRSESCDSEGARRVTTFSSARSRLRSSGDCTNRPAPTRLRSMRFELRARGISRTRTFCLAANTWRAASSKAGAITTSTNCPATSAAVGPSIGWLKAMMPPKAEVGSVARALR